MTHDEALGLVLAGGPVPVEAAVHVRTCAACGSELAALRSMEERLRLGAPPPASPRELEGRVLLRLGHTSRSGWVTGSAAAALLLAAGLWAALLAPGFRSAAPKAPSLSGHPLAVLEFPGETDTTAALLEAYEPVVSPPRGQVSAESVRALLSPSDDGGPNG